MKKLLSYSALFAALWAVIYFEGRYMIFIQEQTQIFQNDWHYIVGCLSQAEGFSQILKEALVQFCHLPLLGSVLLAFVALAAFAGTASCVRSVSGDKGHPELAALAPLVSLIYGLIVCEDTYSLVAYAVTTVVTAGVLKFDRKYKWIAAAIVSPLLFHACGAAAVLLPLFVLADGLANGEDARQKFPAIVPLAVYLIFGFIAVRTDLVGGIKDFFMHRNPLYESNAGFPYSIPALTAWGLALLCLVYALAVSRLSVGKLTSVIVAVSLPMAAGLTVRLFPDKEYVKNVGYERYSTWAELHYLYSKGRYQDLLDLYEDKNPTSSVESNYINLALYRTGRLTSDFVKYRPGWKHHSLRSGWIDMQFPFPFIWVEVCNQMGALAKAHQSAFEGNVLADPRGSAPMMKYLAEAEIIRGNYKTAERYLEKLESTVFYRKWARSQHKFLSDDAVASDEYYSVKRACYYDESRTLYDMNDLWLMKEVIKNSPKHSSTYDYTGVMILSVGEIKTFVEYIVEMSEAGLCKVPLPPIFQQAMTMAFAGKPQVLKLYKVDPRLIEDYKEYSLAVNGKLKNKSMTNAVISKNSDKYWHYLYAISKADSSIK